jgi:hypothetical protein
VALRVDHHRTLDDAGGFESVQPAIDGRTGHI